MYVRTDVCYDSRGIMMRVLHNAAGGRYANMVVLRPVTDMLAMLDMTKGGGCTPWEVMMWLFSNKVLMWLFSNKVLMWLHSMGRTNVVAFR